MTDTPKPRRFRATASVGWIANSPISLGEFEAEDEDDAREIAWEKANEQLDVSVEEITDADD